MATALTTAVSRSTKKPAHRTRTSRLSFDGHLIIFPLPALRLFLFFYHLFQEGLYNGLFLQPLLFSVAFPTVEYIYLVRAGVLLLKPRDGTLLHKASIPVTKLIVLVLSILFTAFSPFQRVSLFLAPFLQTSGVNHVIICTWAHVSITALTSSALEKL